MKLSEKVWAASQPVYDAILQHPFNQKLAQGSLSQDVFSYYIEQDSLYLNDFARCHTIIASKIAAPHVRTFLKYAESALVTEQEVVHQFFRETLPVAPTGQVSPATLSYTSYLLKTCAYEPLEVSVAAVLPCFWIYRESGRWLAQVSRSDNPYQRWIDTYANEDFYRTVEEIIGIFDELGAGVGASLQQKMQEAFYRSTCLEWHFWNDAYQKRALDTLVI